MRLIVLILLLKIKALYAQYPPPLFDVQGHRGARGLQPENTISGFLTALDHGVTSIEMDLAITKDKQVILSHEPWMAPEYCLTPNGNPLGTNEKQKYNLYKMSLEEIKKWDCGSKVNNEFPDQENKKANKPLLTEVIIAVERHIKSYTSYEVDYNIEIKSNKSGDNIYHPNPAEFSDLVFAILDAYLPLSRVVIQSFDLRVLQYWHRKYPEVRVSLLVENKKSIDTNLKELGFIPSIYSPYFKLLSTEKVAYLHTKKPTLTASQIKNEAPEILRVIPWTVNEEVDMRSIKQMGVDGLITDYPNRACSIFSSIK